MRAYNLIFILGIDALEYELVEKLNLNNLKQLEYSKIVVPICEERGVPSSPEVWASFLIGEQVSPPKLVTSSHFKNTISNFLNILHIDVVSSFMKKVSAFLLKLGFYTPIRFGNLNRETFLDITKSKEINAPYYSFDHKTLDISYLFGNKIISLEQAVEKIKLLYEYRKEHIINEIDNIGDKDVVFAFMHTADMLQHCSYLRFSEIEKHYVDLDKYVSVLKRRLADSFGEVIFIIISDHGFDFDKGTHSMKGFYSSNTNLIPKPEKITDFYGIILDLINKSNGLSSS